MKSAMHPEAREEFLAAIDYYNDAEPGLGMAFYSEIEYAIALVERYPDLWIGIGGGIRRCLVRRFPYAILYSHEAGQVYIYAIMNTSRDPDYWRNRLTATEMHQDKTKRKSKKSIVEAFMKCPVDIDSDTLVEPCAIGSGAKVVNPWEDDA